MRSSSALVGDSRCARYRLRVSPLIDLLETSRLPEGPELRGLYDERRGLRVDATGCPVVETGGLTMLATETRGGADRDEAAAAGWLGTVTKQERDRDDPRGLLITKTAGGRDTDDDRLDFAC